MKINLTDETTAEVKILRLEIVDKVNSLCNSNEYRVDAGDKDYIDRATFVSNEPIKFEDDEANQDLVDVLNDVIAEYKIDTTYLGKVNLFVKHDDENLCVSVQHIYNYGGAFGYFIQYDRIHFKIDNSKDILDYIYKYRKENPIVFILDILNYNRKYKKLIADKRVIAMLNRAINEFTELKLIAQACNI